MPLEFASQIPYGELWIRKRDGAVLKIKIATDSVRGMEKPLGEVRDHRKTVTLATTHFYRVERSGICFPSHTSFLFRSPRLRCQTYFAYSKYRFFTVDTQVKTDPPNQ